METMKEAVYDPYNISNYSNPMNQQKTENATDENNTEEKRSTPNVKNVFNPYEEDNNNEDKLNDTDEKTKLKPKKSKSQYIFLYFFCFFYIFLDFHIFFFKFNYLFYLKQYFTFTAGKLILLWKIFVFIFHRIKSKLVSFPTCRQFFNRQIFIYYKILFHFYTSLKIPFSTQYDFMPCSMLFGALSALGSIKPTMALNLF